MVKRINPYEAVQQPTPVGQFLDSNKPAVTPVMISTPAFTEKAPLEGADLVLVNLEEVIAAPKEWNFFIDQKEDAVINLAVSLYNEGQLAPIIVREYIGTDSRYKWESLSGHTRIRAAKYLLSEGYKDWQFLYAWAYPADKCDDNQARRIIVHSNTEQRHSLTPEERQACFYFEYIDERNKDRNIKATSLTEKLMGRYNIKRSHAYNLRKIGDNVISGFQEMFQIGTLSIRDAIALSRMDQAIQKILLENKDKLKDKNLKQFIGISQDEARVLLADVTPDILQETQPLSVVREDDRTITFNAQIPKEAEKDFYKTMQRFYKKFGIVVSK